MNNKNSNSFVSRFKTMFALDLRRMFTTPLIYIMLLISIVMPILILVMTSMMDGSVSINPQTGIETVMEGFDSVWQIIGSNMGESMDMGITSMCNMNMMYFVIGVFVCIFVSSDFRSGYCKNLFTVRSRKDDYVVSKTLVSFIAGAIMMLGFFVGAMLGGVFSGVSFSLEGVTAFNIICSVLSKIFLVGIFVSIFVLASVLGKNKLWLSILLSLGIGMLFFTMIPIISPLNAGLLNVILSFFGSALFAYGIGVASYYILKKISII